MLPTLGLDWAFLRPVKTSDLARWLTYLQGDAVRQGISWRPQRVDELEEFVNAASFEEGARQLRFAIALQSDDSLIGTVGLHSIVRDHRSAEIAYDIHPTHWGRGLASAACEAVTHWARTKGLFRIQATALEDNKASIRVLERCGFKQEGVLRGYRWVDGAARTSLVFSNVPGDA